MKKEEISITPKIIYEFDSGDGLLNENAYVQIVIQVKKCGSCNAYMFRLSKKEMYRLRKLFPDWEKYTLKTQMNSVDWKFNSYLTNHESKEICHECAQTGKASFKCFICKEIRSSDLQEHSFGDPADSICKICYASIPAKQWDEIIDKLHERHKWDFD